MVASRDDDRASDQNGDEYIGKGIGAGPPHEGYEGGEDGVDDVEG